MSNPMKVWRCLFSIFLNHPITSLVFFHWFSVSAFRTLLLIFSSFCLLMTPISLLDGFISLHVGLFRKLGLWSFRVKKASFSAVTLIR